MNRILTALFATALLCATLVYAQQPPAGETTPPETQAPTPAQTSPSAVPAAPAAPAAMPARIAPGSVVPVQLAKTVDAKKAKPGDQVVAKVTQDLKNTSGTIIVPKDTEVIGRVTEAQARNKQQKESELAIAFDKAVLKGGEAMQMPMSIQAIIAPPNRDPNQNNAAGAQPSFGYPGGGSQGPGMPGQPAGSPQGTMGGNAQLPEGMPQDNGNQTGAHAQPQITGNTKGVVGISNLNLSAAYNTQQGSLVTSEKKTVKLEGGTLMLLRVSQ